MHVTIARGLQNCLDLLLKHCSPFLDKCSLKLGYDPACSGVFNREPTKTKCWLSNHLDKLPIVGHCAGETGIVFGVHAGAPHLIASVQSDIHRGLSDQTWRAHGCPSSNMCGSIQDDARWHSCQCCTLTVFCALTPLAWECSRVHFYLIIKSWILPLTKTNQPINQSTGFSKRLKLCTKKWIKKRHFMIENVASVD